MNLQSKPGIGLGALTGLLLSAPLLTVFYIGWQAAGLSFVPFTVFDWIIRVLPGSMVTFGVDTMVRIIRSLNLAETATAAKTGEQMISITGFMIIGIVVGSVYFAIMNFTERKFSLLISLVISSLIGACILFISHSIHQEMVIRPFIDTLWIMFVFLIWGLAFGLVYLHLTLAPAPENEENLSVETLGRRRFLIKLGSAVAVITIFGTALGRNVRSRNKQIASNSGKFWSSHHALPNANALVKPAPGTRPEFTPVSEHYRIDINTTPPVIREESWRLKISGLVEEPLSLTLKDIQSYEPLHQFITLSCISNPIAGDLIGTTRWSGVSLQRLLPKFRLQPNATHLKILAADGFYESVALDQIRTDERVMLAYAWDGVPLTTEHGFPLRIYIPNVYGMKQPKWIESIEVMDHWEDGYWVSRGWDKYAPMKATSVIDTVSIDKITGPDGKVLVPVGGIAHAGTRGISKVEVQVDGGTWEEAKLRTPLSGQTWVIWRYDWPFQKGKHTFTVRCFDGKGTPQITEEAAPHPSGASGLHTRSLMSYLGLGTRNMGQS
jgi:DMSO/TMAO reductase YedYZ molybdopterin-dependent catalytic subunit